MPELVVYAAKDAYMDLHNADVNFGAVGAVHVGALYQGGSKNFLYRAIVNFDVSALAGHVVVGAQLERLMQEFSGTSFGVTIYRCARPAAWTEAGVTWNKYDGLSLWTVSGGDYDGAVPAPVSFVEQVSPVVPPIRWAVVGGLEEFVADALALRGGVVSLIVRADVEVPDVSHESTWYAREYGGTGSNWLLRVFYDVVGESGRRDAAERELAFDNLRGVRPRRGVEPRGGVLPRRPLPALMEVVR